MMIQKNHSPIARAPSKSLKRRLEENPNLLPRLFLGGIAAIAVLFVSFYSWSPEVEIEEVPETPSSVLETPDEFEGMTFEDMLATSGGNGEMFPLLTETGEGATAVAPDPAAPPAPAPSVNALAAQRQERILEQRRLANERYRESAANAAPARARTPVAAPAPEIPALAPKTEEERERERLQRELEAYRAMQENGPKAQAIPARETVNVRASIYNDHRILPGDRITLKLEEDFTYGGRAFKKHTLLFAMASFSKSRVLMTVENIDHSPVELIARDVQDGLPGMYVEQVAEFRQAHGSRFESDVITGTANEVSSAVDHSLSRSLINSGGNLFRSNRIKEKDKIFLISGHQVLLSNQTP